MLDSKGKEQNVVSRGVAQPGSAPGSGPGGRRFKSSRPDHLQNPARHWLTFPFIFAISSGFVDLLWTNWANDPLDRVCKRQAHEDLDFQIP